MELDRHVSIDLSKGVVPRLKVRMRLSKLAHMAKRRQGAESSPFRLVLKLLEQVVTCVRGFVKCFLRVPQLFCNFPAAQASMGNSQKKI